MKKWVLYVFLIVFCFTAKSQDFKTVDKAMLSCFGDDEEYLTLLTRNKNDSFQLTWATDLCEFLPKKTLSPHKAALKPTLWINEKKYELKTRESYYSLLPECIYFGTYQSKKIYIIECNIASHIGTNGYCYLIIDYSSKTAITREVTSATKKTVAWLLSKK